MPIFVFIDSGCRFGAASSSGTELLCLRESESRKRKPKEIEVKSARDEIELKTLFFLWICLQVYTFIFYLIYH